MTKPHKHAEIIKAWADGAEIEYKGLDNRWYPAKNPAWLVSSEYRVKPTPKPDYCLYGNVPNLTFLTRFRDFKSNEIWYEMSTTLSPFKTDSDNVKYTFYGETGKLKNVEVL